MGKMGKKPSSFTSLVLFQIEPTDIKMASHEADTRQNKKPRLGEATDDGTFIQLTKSQIPEYLKSSEFFMSLSPDDDIPFPVPSCCFKSDTTITSEVDVRKLLSTVRFWGVREIVHSLVEYCRKNKLNEDVASEFENELRYVKVFPSFHKAPQKGVMRQALLSGQLNLVCHLLDNGYCFSPYSVSHAIEGGHSECFEYVCRHAFTAVMDRIETHLQDCAKHGRLDFLKYLHKVSEQRMTVESGRAAIRNNHADCLHYIANCLPHQRYSYEWAMLAAELGNLDCLRSLANSSVGLNVIVACNFAARHGHLDCLIFAHEHKPDIWSKSTCTAAAENGHMDCLIYAHQHGCPWDHSACSSAARHGHLHILQYLRENGCTWSKLTIIQALKYKQLPCLKYAVSHGCYKSGHDALCTLAAEAGALECLQYLCQQGYLCDSTTLAAALQGEHDDCIAYLRIKMAVR